MAWIVVSVLIILVSLGVAAALRSGAIEDNGVIDVPPVGRSGSRNVLIGGAALFIVWTLFSSYHQVSAGHVGLVYQFGSIVGETDDGPQFIPPWQSVRTVDVQVQAAFFGRTDDKDKVSRGLTTIAAASSETQNIFIDATVNYQLDRGTVRELYRNVGPEWFDRLIPSRVQQYFKAEIVNYGAVEVTTNREKIREAVTAALDEELDKYGISVPAVQIDNLAYSDEFDGAIERKQVATQNALAAEEVVAQKEAEARQQVASAKGAADSKIEAARGDAESTRINAEAQAAANAKLSASLTPALIQYEAIKKIEGTKVAILPSGQGLLLDPSTLLGQLVQQ